MSGRNTHGWQRALICSASLFCLTSALQADVLVNDTWRDGTDSDPAAPTYSEAGIDADVDGDLESAWYRAGVGTLDPVGANGPLRGSLPTGGTSSATWLSYFTPEASPVSLNSGDRLRVTWNFSLAGVNASNTSQAFRIAVVDSPSAARINADGFSQTSTVYSGYSMFMNMGQTLGNSNPFRLMERNATSGDILGAGGSWTALANGATAGNVGYADSVAYSYVMDLLRNPAGELEITSTMTGGNLNGVGFATVSFVDTTPQSFTYDTFVVRPSQTVQTAETFDTSLFKVEYIAVPEPTTLSLLAGVGALVARRRR